MKKIKRYAPICLLIFLLIATVAIYLFFCLNEDVEISTIIGTILAIIGGVAFWIEFYHKNKVEEANFIIELNNQFISDPNMTSVEHRLEQYYALVRKGGSEQEKEQFLNDMRNTYAITNPERQHLVNYVVHLESIAALVNSGAIRLKAINDLMAYRYFIAVNNPVVQKLELFEYKEYYNGCFEIYPKWKKYIENMPLQETPLIPEKSK